MTGAAAFVRNDRLDILGGNQLGYALYSEMFAEPAPAGEHRPLRLPRPARPRLLRRLGARRAATPSPCCAPPPAATPTTAPSPTSSASSRRSSEAFRTHWAAHNVRFHLNGVKHFHHPVVGDLSLNFERLDLAADTGLTIFTYTAEPGSRDEEALRLLGSWAATLDQTTPALG